MKKIAIIGGGASALMLAATLDSSSFDVTIYERNQALARKFLVAGDGGLNLTHSEDLELFIKRYTSSGFMEPYLRSFSNTHFRDWLQTIGVETFVGTSKRVFPKLGVKPIEVLNAIMSVLKKKKVKIVLKHEWIGWNAEGELLFENKLGQKNVTADIVVFALGGASWQKTGSDGTWSDYFRQKGVRITPFRPSNCAVRVDWPPSTIEKMEGENLKNITTTCGGETKVGELVITKFGLEGGAIYAQSPHIRHELEKNGKALIQIDLKPSYSQEQILSILANKQSKSISSVLKDKLHLSETQQLLLKTYLSKEEYTSLTVLAHKIKHFELEVIGLAFLDEAISTVGGVALDEVGKNLELYKLPNHFVMGEMMDWDAPTGGYLLQACFSMGKYLGDKLNAEN